MKSQSPSPQVSLPLSKVESSESRPIDAEQPVTNSESDSDRLQVIRLRPLSPTWSCSGATHSVRAVTGTAVVHRHVTVTGDLSPPCTLTGRLAGSCILAAGEPGRADQETV